METNNNVENYKKYVLYMKRHILYVYMFAYTQRDDNTQFSGGYSCGMLV